MVAGSVSGRNVVLVKKDAAAQRRPHAMGAYFR
jgi:hypothetical protein